MYLWYFDGPDGLVVVDTPPSPRDLPLLPEPWIEANRVDSARNNSNSAINGEKKSTTPTTPCAERSVINVIQAMTEGAPSGKVAQRLGEAIAELAQGLSRHDTVRDNVMALLRYGRNGEPGVEVALRAVCCCFVAAVAMDRDGGEPVAEAEFMRMITNAEPILAADPPHEPFVWPTPSAHRRRAARSTGGWR
jgi:hypothetical protein